MEPEDVRELIALAGKRFPGALELALLASPAPRIDAELLRAIRLHAAPHVDAGAEADLWFGPLVESRGAGAVTLDESVAASLREELALEWAMGGRRQQRVRRARVAMDRVHASLSPALALEERLAWMAIEGAATSDIEDELWSAVRALADPDRPGVAHWANQAWPRLPAAAQSTRAGLALRDLSKRQLMPAAGPGQGELSQGDIEAGLADALRAVPLTPLGLDWTPQWLRLGDVHGRDAVEIMVPDLDPHWIEVSWIRHRALRRDTTLRTFEVRLGRDEVAELEAPASDRLRLVTASGDVYEVLRPSAPADTTERSAPPSAPARRSTAADGTANKLESWVTTSAAPVWRLAQRIPPLERRVNRRLIENAMRRTPPPRPAAEHVSVQALSDQSYAGRLLPPEAEAGPRPSAEAVAQLFHRDEFVASPKSTLLFAFFAQWFSETFVRSADGGYSGQRDIMRTEAAQHVDLAQIYGLHPTQTEQLRARENGLLKSQLISGEEYPTFLYDDHGAIKGEFSHLPARAGLDQWAPAARARLFATGMTGNTFFGFTMLTVLFLREHNRLARELSAEHPHWSDDRLFDIARNVLTVILIKLLVEEYMNHLAGSHFKRRFDPDSARRERANTRTAVEFNLVYRWHSLVPDDFHVAGRDIPLLEQDVYDTEVLTGHGLGQLFDDASHQAAGEIALFNTNAGLLGSAELPAIEHGRAAHLRSYNDYRELAGYPRVTRFDQISSDPRVREGLGSIYADVDELEFYVGLLAEDRRPNSVLGPLAQRLVEQHMFTQLMSHPLLEAGIFGEESFGGWGLATIQMTSSLEQILRRNIPDPLEHQARFTRADWRPA